MSRHTTIIKLGTALGYFDLNDRYGICNGITMAWIEACILDEEHIFNARVEYICSLSDPTSFITELRLIKEKVKRRNTLTSQENKLLDVLSFFEKIALYQKPTQYRDIFDATIMQIDSDKVSAIIVSDKILVKGGLITLSTQVKAYNPLAFKEYLICVSNDLLKFNHTLDKQLILKIILWNSTIGPHALGLCYEPSEAESCWRFMDINNESSKLYSLVEIELLVNEIQRNYFIDQNKEMIIGISVISTHHLLASQPTLKNVFNNISPQHITSDETKINLLVIAMVSGDLNFIEQCSLNEINHIILHLDSFIHQRSWEYLLDKGYVTEKAILNHRFSLVFNLDMIIAILNKIPEAQRIHLLTETKAFSNLLRLKYPGSNFDLNVKNSLLSILRLCPEDIRFMLMANEQVLKIAVLERASFLDDLFEMIPERFFLRAIRFSLKIATNNAQSLAIILNKLPTEQRFSALANAVSRVFDNDLNEYVEEDLFLLHKISRDPACLDVVFRMLPEEQHLEILNQIGTVKENRDNPSCNLLHAAVYAYSAESLKILLKHLPPSICLKKLLEEKDGLNKSVWELSNTREYREFSQIILNSITLEIKQSLIDHKASIEEGSTIFFKNQLKTLNDPKEQGDIKRPPSATH